jgi:hypothetical protein
MDYTSNNVSILRITHGDNIPSENIDLLTPFQNMCYFYITASSHQRLVSLTLDILKNKNKADELWGFIETSNPNLNSEQISTACCFGGQNILFYLKAEDTNPTSIKIYSYDFTTYQETLLRYYNTISYGSDSDFRYFSWTAPSVNTTYFSTNGLYGKVNLKIIINRLINEKSYDHELIVQLLIYSAGKEALTVSPSFSILKDNSFSETTSLLDIYPHLLISNYEDINLPLTNLQKEAIVADQIAVLFMSQHQMVPADYFPTKILGIGAEAAISGNTIATRHQSYIDPISLPINRLYGLKANNLRFNYIDDFNNCFGSLSQSNQNLVDIQKTIAIDESGNLISDIWDKGFLLNPYAIDINNVEVLYTPSEPNIMEVQLSNNNFFINNIYISNQYDKPIDNSTNLVKLGFTILNIPIEILQIRYYIWINNYLNYLEYVETNNLNRYHIFDLTSSQNVYVTDSISDIIYGQIEIDTIDNLTNVFRIESLIRKSFNGGITSIKASQRRDSTSYVDIIYNYKGASEIDNSTVSVEFSQDNGETWEAISEDNLRGDIGYGISSGNNHIVWAPLGFDNSSTIEFANYILIKLTITDIDNIVCGGKTQCGVALSFSKPEVYIRRIDDDEPSSTSSSTLQSLTSSSSTLQSFTSSSSSSSYWKYSVAKN